MSQIVTQFGKTVERAIPRPTLARALLLTGYRVKSVQLAMAPDKRLPPARQYAAQAAMETIIGPMAHPGRSAIVNVFMPCELLQAFDILPFFAEAAACYLNGAEAERGFIRYAENAGVSPTLCSYHKALLGLGLSGAVGRPLFTACTSLACDANNLTFRKIAQELKIPSFYLDIPYDRDEDAVRDVADQLREFASFLERVTGRHLDKTLLSDAVGRSGETLSLLREIQAAKVDHALPTDVTSESYEVFLTHPLLGTPQALRYARQMRDDLKSAPAGKGLRLLWAHTIPFFQAPVREMFNFAPDVQIVTCDMNIDTLDCVMDPDHPFESMARRLVYNSFNGSSENRIRRDLELCRSQKLDGVVYFCQWGCKQTMGSAQLFRRAFEEAGIPVLLLDGDGCDRANTSDGQTATRLGAFLEMLRAQKEAK
ncbi:MAG: 2-hydroxyacyl-CoA dehydratase family protein [Gemmiger sp.]|uniref:2-hydroxyacyl-CoA dehydratase subunit D n=1 Tax=Gemmiger sp. TaxID=2049027 RepID=UPI002E77E078|nr:2-hydroxyacyl-CoA dehydratase family protein [Gemmiger sp.]MEE0800009.1 2-hydroxyacyl-CoA dehydratase family protein [Gemmiger sp.]